MSKLLKEGLFDALLNVLARGKVNKAVDKLKKDPEIKKSIENVQKAQDDLKSSVDAYVEKYGETDKLKKLMKI